MFLGITPNNVSGQNISYANSLHFLNTPNGYISFGPADATRAHIQTDAPFFEFNKGILSYGDLTMNGNSTINGHSATNGSSSILFTPSPWSIAMNVKIVDNSHKGETKVINASVDVGGASNDIFTVWGNGVVNAKKVYAEEVEVRADAMGTNWPDYVFKTNYSLMSLYELESFINKNSHLPNVPSEEVVLEKGINLGEMDAVLLRKIEELTLYVIQQQKEIGKLTKITEQIDNRSNPVFAILMNILMLWDLNLSLATNSSCALRERSQK